MLGETLSDPMGVESGGSMRGMELLPMDTVFAADKTRTQAEGIFCEMDGVFSTLSGVSFSGYEILMGQSLLHSGSHTLTRLTVNGE